ncbi:Papilin [Amphibalanus amphitrite]|uniref:Papilin n=1 Tax=Amphibalanus amphitrite TaxID=1232801 RepID=A0A6A4VUR9_AMPAM|nr:Papilin [Amphibalanus amphitrite]
MAPLLLLVVGGALAAVTRAAPEDCGLPKARGSCNQFAVRYYYDTEYGGCLRFWYGGCDGNVRGACKRAHTRWYSDPASGGCRQFTYSGCLGNANRFESEAECQQRCGRVSPDSGTGGSGGGTGGVVPQPGPADCLLPDRVAGGCSEYVIRYSYVAARQQCAPFYYGGCGGNGNRFDSAETCRAACVKPPPTRPPYYAPPREREGQPGGSQTDYGRTYYGRAERPDYERRDYGREERPDYRRPDYGREERPDYRRPDYGREEQPEPTEAPAPITEPPQPAGDPCSLSADPGRCRAYMPSYYFNSARGGCERFIYGGCGGNDNRFTSLA